MNDRKKFVTRHLDEKLAELKKIFPSNVFDANDFYFAGGCIYSLWQDKEPKDYDIFCKNKKAIRKLVRFFKANMNLCNFTTRNAITMGKFQFITKHIGEPEVEVSKFDFKHNMFFYDKGELKTVSGWEYINSNKLHFNSDRARNILNIVSRIPKFVNRGMEISQKEVFDILEVGTRPTRIFQERRSIKKSRKGKAGY